MAPASRAHQGGKFLVLRVHSIAAANPASTLLQAPGPRPVPGRSASAPSPHHTNTPVPSSSPRSDYSYIPKLAAVLKLLDQFLRRGEQTIVFSAFHDSLDALATRLTEAGVHHVVLDGRITQAKRGKLAAQFKRGWSPHSAPRTPHFPVALASVECMAELHSFHLCKNVVLMAYSWAWDKFEQAINRVHRLNSPSDVHVWSVLCNGSIDRRLESLIQEKGDAAELVLDGRLFGENSTEVNLAELLRDAQSEFSSALRTPHSALPDEAALEKSWPALRRSLSSAVTGAVVPIIATPPNPSIHQSINPTPLPASSRVRSQVPLPTEPNPVQLRFAFATSRATVTV